MPDPRQDLHKWDRADFAVAPAVLLVLAVPFVLALWSGASGLAWFAAGALAWLVSVAVKMALWGVLDRGAGKRVPGGMRAAAGGLLSAACELGGAAAAFAWLPAGDAWLAAAFGAGAGGLENIALLAIGIAASGRGAGLRSDAAQATAPPMPRHMRWNFVVERGSTLLGHIGARGLVWLGLHGTPCAPFVAVVTFSLVDGIAGYGKERKWDWLSWPTWKRFNAFLFALGLVELSLFVALAMR